MVGKVVSMSLEYSASAKTSSVQGLNIYQEMSVKVSYCDKTSCVYGSF